MNKLEVGMYVRTNMGKIDKIIDIKEEVTMNYSGTSALSLNSTNIYTEKGTSVTINSKASHNIIDLIEDGDYVNGYKIVVKNDIKNIITENGVEFFGIFWITNIKSIVTKEQFSSMEFRLGE